MILNLTLPFYGGATTSALETLGHHYLNGYIYRPQNTPEPTRQPEAHPAPPPSPSPSPTPSPSPSPKPSPTPELTPTPEPGSTPEPGIEPSDSPGAITDPSQEDDPNQGGLPAVTGMDLQKLLDAAYRNDDRKVAYLTFDDGPAPHITNAILDILREENVKATFFSIGNLAEVFPDEIRRQYEEGHGIGNHTYTHKFRQIYADPQNFVDELIKTEGVYKSILGEDKTFRLIRFPGGSFGDKLEPFREAVNEAGFAYIDWNCVNGDAETLDYQSPQKLLSRVKETTGSKSGLIVLMHDAPGKETTVEALPSIIEYLRSKGYEFELLPGSR